MTDEVQALADLKTSVDGLSGRFADLTKEVRAQRAWTRRRFIGVALVLLAMVAAVAFGAVGLRYSVHEAHCNRTYNNASAQRSSVVSPQTVKLNLALGGLVRTLNPASGSTAAQQQAAFNNALVNYYGQLDQYVNDVVNNPLPLAPKYAC